ncbi:HTH-type transcriptional activator IlvY [Marinagarivorans algicola]|uniref:HTH-type transcriptional activator IlvY n=1 Tax=Marinagarivorans algicola TaxID=1513270 RepID=UPI0006B942C9|nr:HTH-type transcriptional activator IlvY [Marinagarivorans algicola]
MNSEKLQHFIVLAQTQHFARAAERCHVSPSTFSRSIAQLEEELGTQLVERDNRSVALTSQGHKLALVARQILQQWNTLSHSVQQQEELEGSLSIYCSVTASYSFLYDILANFRQAHPKIAIRVHTGDPAAAIERVRQGHEDIAIAANDSALPSNLCFRQIAHSPLVFITPQHNPWPIAASTKKSALAQAFSGVPFILSEQGVARKRINSWFTKHKIQPTIYAQAAGNEAIVSMVSLGFGVGLVPAIVLDNSPLLNKVQQLDYQPELAAYDVGVCVLQKRLKSPVIHAFWELLSSSRTPTKNCSGQ